VVKPLPNNGPQVSIDTIPKVLTDRPRYWRCIPCGNARCRTGRAHENSHRQSERV